MTMKMLVVLGVAMFVLAAESQAQYWRPQNTYTYQQQRYPQQTYQRYPQQQQQQANWQFQLPAGISVTEADWVCKNSKGDMMIITSEGVPAINNGQGQQWQPQQPTYPQQQPSVNIQPASPQAQPTPTQPPIQPSTYPNVPTTQNPNYPNNPNQQQPGQGEPNTNGDGVIDIRFGSNKK